MSSSRWEFHLPSSAWSPWSGNREPDVERQADGGIPLEKRSSIAASFSIFSEPEILSSSIFGSRRSRSTRTTVLADLIEVRAGTGDNAKVLSIDRTLLCSASSYFAGVISNRHVELPEDDPVAVELFIKWAGNQEGPVTYDPDQYSAEPWPSKAAVACVFARKIKAESFEKYALSQFIQNCSSLAFGPWAYIEQKTEPEDPLRKFSDYWVAWNCYFLAGQGENEFSGLEAAVLGCFVTDKTKDPRTFDLEHWYDDCGNSLDPACLHHEALRLEKREREKNAEVEPIVEWGRSFELRREAGLPEPKPPSPSPVLRPVSRPVSPIYPSPPASVYNPPYIPQYQPTYAPRPIPPAPVYSSHGCCEGSSCWGCCCGSLWALVFAAQVAVIIALPIFMIRKDTVGIRYTTKTYTLFVGAVGGVTFFIGFAFPFYCFFAMAGGIALALDTKTVCTVSIPLSHLRMNRN
ncbi:hypothetical protein G7Y89_g6372 [Cudoniella acicularis]|uniref:BTB domain-containing protein n=1 Tax=Cudoniella acicularis TaxID=354080 RepID=A0A8H4W331_9HELO|nr:hypothetical protein G7Y89_g6372 [Cudoniella acicularis]